MSSKAQDLLRRVDDALLAQRQVCILAVAACRRLFDLMQHVNNSKGLEDVENILS